jgi:hypothetical protein
MSVTRVTRYLTKPECADENARLIGAVFADLDTLKPDGMQYKGLRLEDGLTRSRRNHDRTGEPATRVGGLPGLLEHGPRRRRLWQVQKNKKDQHGTTKARPMS